MKIIKKINPRLLIWLIIFLFVTSLFLVEKIKSGPEHTNTYTITSTSDFKEDGVIEVELASTFGLTSSKIHTLVPMNDKYSVLLNSENFKSQNCSVANKHSSAFSGKVKVKKDTFPYQIFLLNNKEFCQIKGEVRQQRIYGLVVVLMSCLISFLFYQLLIIKKIII